MRGGGGRPRGGQREGAPGRGRPRPRRHRQLRDALPGERPLPARPGIPWVYGACVGSYGLALLVRPHVSPCLRCLLEERPAAGLRAHLRHGGGRRPHRAGRGRDPGRGGLEAAGRARPSRCSPGLVTVDLWQGVFDVMDLRGRAPWCPACTEGRYDYAAPGATGGSAVLCGRDAVQLRPPAGGEDRPRRAGGAPLRGRARCARRTSTWCASRPARAELVVFRDGRAIVKGVRDPAQARSVYAKYVGA